MEGEWEEGKQENCVSVQLCPVQMIFHCVDDRKWRERPNLAISPLAPSAPGPVESLTLHPGVLLCAPAVHTGVLLRAPVLHTGVLLAPAVQWSTERGAVTWDKTPKSILRATNSKLHQQDKCSA